jgi:signal-transduction protein with cAMP-binding, CBS, and nucleotidyltransferase domain
MIVLALKEAFDKYFPLPLEFWGEFVQAGEIVQYNKDEVLKEVNKVENYLHFILEGCGGILLWNKNNFICTDLIFEADFFCDYYSFLTRQSTPYEVLTFEKTNTFRIAYNDLNSITNKSPWGDKFWRYANQALYVDKHMQYIQAFSKTAGEIYGLILEHQPEILQRVPQKYIASFLGITPQSLSRIRNNL